MFSNEFKGFCLKDFARDIFETTKHKRNSYLFENIERQKNPFQLIHCDVWGLAPTTDIHGSQWFLIHANDFNRFTWINLLKHKSEVTMKIN